MNNDIGVRASAAKAHLATGVMRTAKNVRAAQASKLKARPT